MMYRDTNSDKPKTLIEEFSEGEYDSTISYLEKSGLYGSGVKAVGAANWKQIFGNTEHKIRLEIVVYSVFDDIEKHAKDKSGSDQYRGHFYSFLTLIDAEHQLTFYQNFDKSSLVNKPLPDSPPFSFRTISDKPDLNDYSFLFSTHDSSSFFGNAKPTSEGIEECVYEPTMNDLFYLHGSNRLKFLTETEEGKKFVKRATVFTLCTIFDLLEDSDKVLFVDSDVFIGTDNQSALHILVSNVKERKDDLDSHYMELLRQLLRVGVDYEESNAEGFTPQQVAQQFNAFSNIIPLLDPSAEERVKVLLKKEDFETAMKQLKQAETDEESTTILNKLLEYAKQQQDSNNNKDEWNEIIDELSLEFRELKRMNAGDEAASSSNNKRMRMWG